ncbi:MAG TPA: AAA family ATPase [Phycisphaerales bacterium]|nr:AAA family ATPase [Phycisphaerales bacterium]
MKNIYGQTRAIDLLMKANDEERRHHAWIFSGPRGVGKCTIAIQFAEHLLRSGDGVGTSHQDLHIIRKEDVVWSTNPSLQRRKQTNIPLDLLRERIIGGKTSDGKHHDAIAFKTPVLGKEKVFIIDEAELLDEAGQNALLKTLEEPPPGTTIILVTCREDLLLPTVVSRCQILPFSPLQEEEMRAWGGGYSGEATPDELSWAIRFSCGSPGLVCEALEAELPILAESIGGFLSLEKLGSYTEVGAKLISFIEKNVSRWVKENPNTSKDAANRRAMRLVLMVFGEAAQKLIREGHPDGICLAGVLIDIETQLSTNISIKVLLESLSARWASVSIGDALFM